MRVTVPLRIKEACEADVLKKKKEKNEDVEEQQPRRFDHLGCTLCPRKAKLNAKLRYQNAKQAGRSSTRGAQSI